MSNSTHDRAKEIAQRYDQNYGAIRRWIIDHPGGTFYAALATVIATAVIFLKIGLAF